MVQPEAEPVAASSPSGEQTARANRYVGIAGIAGDVVEVDRFFLVGKIRANFFRIRMQGLQSAEALEWNDSEGNPSRNRLNRPLLADVRGRNPSRPATVARS